MATKKKTKKGKASNSKKANVAKDASKQTSVEVKKEAAPAKKAKDGNSKANKAPKKTAKKKKPNIFVRAVNYVKGVFSELKKVSWLTSDELMKSTSVVAGIVAILTFITWIMDSGLGALAALLLGSK